MLCKEKFHLDAVGNIPNLKIHRDSIPRDGGIAGIGVRSQYANLKIRRQSDESFARIFIDNRHQVGVAGYPPGQGIQRRRFRKVMQP